MSTTIDSLQIEIQSSSSNAAGGIDKLAASLERLKKVGSFNVVIKNLNNLSSALGKLQNSSSGLKALNSLASSIESLKKAGSFARLVKGLKDLESINIDGVVDKITELNDKIGPVSQNLVAVGNAFKVVNAKTTTASKGFSVFGGKINTTALNLSNIINVLRGVKAALAPVVGLLEKTISQAIEWDGISQRFGRGFGEQAEEVYSWVKRLNEEMGINVQQFMQYSSTYATMLTGFGVANKDASKMALGYMELTYDIWAGYNDIYKSMDDAATAIRSAIAGEVEPIRKAGFTIIESTLEQTAANHGLKISLENATEAQKSYLRYLALVDQAQAQGLVGTYAKELNTAEGMMRTLTQQTKSLSEAFGSFMLPVLVEIVPWLQALVELLGEAVISAANFFGVDIQKVDFGSSGMGDLGASADSATESIDGTKNAIKELKQATIGIDELNVISPNTQSASGGGGAAGAMGGLDINSLWDESIFDHINSTVDELKVKIKEFFGEIKTELIVIGALLVTVGLVKKLIDFGIAIGKVRKIMIPAIGFIKDYFFAVKALTPEVGFLAAAFPKLSSTISSMTTALSGAIKAVSAFITGLSATTLATIAVAVIAVASAVYFLYKNWEDVKQAVKDFFTENAKLDRIKESWEKIKEALSPLAPIFVKIKEALQPVIDALGKFFENLNFGKIIEGIGAAVLFPTISSIVGVINYAISVISGFIQIIAGLVEIVAGVIEAIVKLFQGDLSGAWDACKKIGQGIADVFVGLYDTTIGAVVSFVDGVVDLFVGLWDILVGHSIVPDTIDGIVKCFTGLPGRVLGVVGTFVGNVIGKFNDFGSKLVSKISSGWDSVKKWWSNNVKLSIPSLSLKVTYTTSGLGTVKKAIVKALGLSGWPKISFAANGGIFDMGSLVWAGESGPEIVANAGGNSGGTQAVNVYLDGRQITSSVEQHQKERGASIMGNQVYAY